MLLVLLGTAESNEIRLQCHSSSVDCRLGAARTMNEANLVHPVRIKVIMELEKEIVSNLGHVSELLPMGKKPAPSTTIGSTSSAR